MLHWPRHTRATRLYVGVRELNNLTKPDIDAVPRRDLLVNWYVGVH
jgi:hypothetical protein